VSVGLDIYVGSLTRYHAGNWELITQKVAREMNVPLTVVRLTPDPVDTIRDQEQIRPLVLAWRDGLSRALREGPGSAEDLDWNESADSPYFTDKPTWDSYADLMLRAAHNERPELACPDVRLVDWGSDPAYKICAREGHASRYSHVYDVELWLPCPFGYVFRTQNILGKSVLVGSSVTLLAQLAELNRRIWQADNKLLAQWRFDGAEHGAPLETGARFAFAIFHELAQRSVAHRLPMCLDW
jgi:hypothetical protein